jgi:hypothetical protein
VICTHATLLAMCGSNAQWQCWRLGDSQDQEARLGSANKSLDSACAKLTALSFPRMKKK